MAVASSVSGHEKDGGLFPSWFLWPFFFVVSAFRVYYVLQPKNWWIMHPDEVYQALEVAHSEMYGYGFRAYEYNPPPKVDPDSARIRQQELEHGMAALRSYLLPHVYVTVTWVLELLGLSFTPFLTWKVAHTIAASTLLLAVYRYVRVVFRSHDTACLAAILCATSGLLHVFGTHTLVNSLLSAPVFWALAHVHTLVSPSASSEELSENASGQDLNRNKKSSAAPGNAFRHAGPNKALTMNGQTYASKQQSSSTSRNKGKQQKQAKPGQKQKSAAGNMVTNRGNVNNNNNNHAGRTVAHDSGAPHATEKSCASVNGDTNSGAVQTSSDNKRSAPRQENGLASHVHSTRRFKLTRGIARFLLDLGAGFVLGVCVYIRVDVAALAVFTLLPHWRPLGTRYIDVVVCGVGSACGLAVGVLDDFWCYGWGVVTPYNWYKFNIQKDYSAILFGRNDLHKYVLEIFFDNAGMMALSAVCCACAVLLLLARRPLPPTQQRTSRHGEGSPSRQSEEDGGGNGEMRMAGLHPGWQGALARTCLSWFLLLALYSSKGHKELRFVHNVIVLILVTWAVLLQSGLPRLTSCLTKQKLALAVGVASFALSQWQDVAHLTDRPERGGNRMAFKKTGDTQDVNQCLYFLSSRDDLTGVFLDKNLYGTGGYTLLHRDVPFFTIFGPNFMEFRREDRMVEPAKDFFGPRRSIAVSYVAKFSNFISPQHSLHVFKYVFKDPRYNYVVSLAERDLSDFGFGESIFSCRTYKVYRRPARPSALQRRQIQETLDSRPPVNVTSLLQEADMLLYHGVYRRAQERFRLLLSADPTQVIAYLSIAVCHRHLGELEKSVAVMEECYAKFNRTLCEKKRVPSIKPGHWAGS